MPHKYFPLLHCCLGWVSPAVESTDCTCLHSPSPSMTDVVLTITTQQITHKSTKHNYSNNSNISNNIIRVLCMELSSVGSHWVGDLTVFTFWTLISWAEPPGLGWLRVNRALHLGHKLHLRKSPKNRQDWLHRGYSPPQVPLQVQLPLQQAFRTTVLRKLREIVEYCLATINYSKFSP